MGLYFKIPSNRLAPVREPNGEAVHLPSEEATHGVIYLVKLPAEMSSWLEVELL